ncbi:MAG: UPF0104 family protein [Chloroflexia bacterium]|nr:UPF0104 family protein [Chloroflexia bacterium]
MAIRRISWAWVISIILIAVVISLAYTARHEISAAWYLLQTADPLFVTAAFGTILLGFVCAGLIYGEVLTALAQKEKLPWLIATALVAIMLNQTVPMGSVAAYAFLVTALRKRGFPASSVAVVAGTELLSWNGAALLMFSGGLLYLSVTANFTASLPITSALATAISTVFIVMIIVTRPVHTVNRWLHTIRTTLQRLRIDWNIHSAELLIEEIAKSRAIFAARPGRFMRIILLQMLIFSCHALALTFLLHSMRLDVPYPHVLAAYGMSLIASLFTLLPGGGGAVEAALSITLHLQGVPLKGALGAAILFRLLSFWMLLPLGGILYRMLTHTPPQEHTP